MQTVRGQQTFDQRHKSLQEKLHLNLQLCCCCACAVIANAHTENHEDMRAANSSLTSPFIWHYFLVTLQAIISVLTQHILLNSLSKSASVSRVQLPSHLPLK